MEKKRFTVKVPKVLNPKLEGMSEHLMQWAGFEMSADIDTGVMERVKRIVLEGGEVQIEVRKDNGQEVDYRNIIDPILRQHITSLCYVISVQKRFHPHHLLLNLMIRLVTMIKNLSVTKYSIALYTPADQWRVRMPMTDYCVMIIRIWQELVPLEKSLAPPPSKDDDPPKSDYITPSSTAPNKNPC